jgi:hypothetical protein
MKMNEDMKAELVLALDPVIEAAVEDDEEGFGEAAQRFMDTYRALQLRELDWAPLPALHVLEAFLARDETVDLDYPAIVASIKQYALFAHEVYAQQN